MPGLIMNYKHGARVPTSTYRLVVGIVALLALMALAGCGGDTATVTPTQPAAAVPTNTAMVAAPPTDTAVVAVATNTAPVPEATNTEAAGAPTDTAAVGASGPTYTNPVLHSNFPDPFVLLDNNTYYAYATNGAGKNIQAAKSTDLVNWTMLNDAMPALPTWAKLGGSFVWAPEAIKIGSKYVMYYVARDRASNKQCVGVATADTPDGKFKDTNSKAFVCQADMGGTIDPDVFRDGDKLYLYYKNDGNCCNMATNIWAQELAPDGLSLTGEPTKIESNDAPWEGTVVEAPTMWKHDNKYYLLYSGNSYAGFQYAVGYAACQSPTGPCQDAPENPILASRMKEKPLVVGPGHQALLQVGDQTWIIYHVWDVLSSGMTGSNRYVYIDRVDWKDGKPVIHGPTTDVEPAPAVK